MRKTTMTTFIISFIILNVFMSLASRAAVESVGEINAKDNNAGTVIAGTTSDLILSMIVDMSRAEPGEDIEAIRISLPDGLSAEEKAVKKVTIAGKEIQDFIETRPDKNTIIVTLLEQAIIIVTCTVAVEFTVDVSPIPRPQLSFIVGLVAISQQLVVASIKSGNADGRLNNDSLSIKSVLATKPLPPLDVKVQPDPEGENDLILTWIKSIDPGVNGYYIYRSDKKPDERIDVPGRDRTSYTDINLTPGQKYSYTIYSYKTENLISDPSNTVSAIPTKDTKAPSPPIQLKLEPGEKGIKLSWEASPSGDVVVYIIYRGSSINSLVRIGEAKINESSYIDIAPPETGSYLYVVAAVDEAGNEGKSAPSETRYAMSGAKPQPNPFTPRSTDPRFNRVTFPATLVKGGEGTFIVKIFDLEGNLVFEDQGSVEIKWNGKDMNDKYVNSGIYIYQATMGDKYKIGSVIVAK